MSFPVQNAFSLNERLLLAGVVVVHAGGEETVHTLLFCRTAIEINVLGGPQPSLSWLLDFPSVFCSS